MDASVNKNFKIDTRVQHQCFPSSTVLPEKVRIQLGFVTGKSDRNSDANFSGQSVCE